SEPGLEAVGIGQADAAIQGRPAHELGEQEVARPAAYLPDAAVVLLPAARRLVHQPAQERPFGSARWVRRREPRAVERLARLVIQLRGVEHVAVDVELLLERRGIADAHRPGLA